MLQNSLARIIQDAQQPRRLRLEQMETAGVVEELNVRPLDALALVFLLFVFEDVLERAKWELVSPSNRAWRTLTRLK